MSFFRMAFRLVAMVVSSSQPNRMKAYISVLSFITLASFVAQAQDFDYSFKENYEVSVPAQLAILCSDGNLDVIPSDGNKIQVFYIVKKGNKLLKIDRKELEEEFRVDVVQTSNSVNISVRNKRENQPFNFD